MGIRKKAYWFRQADAINRQYIMTVARAIAIVFMSKEDRERAIDELELVDTAKNSRNQRSEAVWDLMQFSYKMRGGKGV